MRVSMVSEHASPLAVLGGVDAGGQNVHVAGLASALTRLGHDVTVYTRRDDPDLPPDVLVPEGYRVVHVDAGPPGPLPKDDLLPHMRQMGVWMHREWRVDPPDLVHAHFWMSGLAAHVAARELEIPVVQTFHALGVVKRRHQGSADTSPEARIPLERSLAMSSARVVAMSSDELGELVHMGVDRRRVAVVPSGVDLDHFTPAGPMAPRGERPRLLSLGRLVERKGVDTLVRALRNLPGVELVVAGGPDVADLELDPEVVRLRCAAESAGVADRVQFLGRVGRAELPALIRSCDVVVCTPWYEPFGIVPLEAMACGRAVVASNAGGLADTVVDGVTGVLVPPRRPDALAIALRHLLADPVQLEAMGLAAADRASIRYSWQRVAQETENVYATVVEDAAVARRVSR